MTSLPGCGSPPPPATQPATAPASTLAANGASGAPAPSAVGSSGGGPVAPSKVGSAGGGPAGAATGAATLGQTNEITGVLTRLVDVLKSLVAAIQSRVAGAAGGGPAAKGCSSGGGGHVPTQTVLQTPLRPSQVGAAGGGPAPSGGGFRTPATWGTGAGNGITDRALAQRWYDYMRSNVMARFADVNQAYAAGYTRNPSSGEYPIHLINNQIFRTADGRDVTMPSTLMYERDRSGRMVLVGVMISSDFNKPMPYFGAGQWHRHPGDPQANMHVWFNKPLDSAFEMETGVV